LSVQGLFDWSPMEEIKPIWLTERVVVLYGDEIRVPPGEKLLPIRLEKSRVFGTGGHPATRAAVHAMNVALKRYFDDRMPPQVVELGNSTGLLALIGAAAGADWATLLTDDPASAQIALENTVINDLVIEIGSPLQYFAPWSCVYQHGIPSVPETDLLVTQCGGSEMARPWVEDVFASLAPGGVVVWAGHSSDHHHQIKHELEEWFHEATTYEFEGWPVLLAHKADPGPLRPENQDK